MIIPVRCFTCGKVIADKWNGFVKRVEQMKEQGLLPKDDEDPANNVVLMQNKTPKGTILDELGLTRMCCRTHMLTHVDLIDII